MLVGFFTSGGLLLSTDVGWVEGPLIGCLASSLCYVVVSLLTRNRSRGAVTSPAL
jgi:sodium/pantothenate symporter